MREIEFRGKDIHFNKWVYGYYHYLANTKEECILEYYRNTSTVIDRNTLGQYTGLKDKNSKMIFEGDIVKQSIHYINSDEDEEYVSIVKWKQDWCAFALNHINGMIGSSYFTVNDNVEVVGNIYDNPELLEVEK